MGKSLGWVAAVCAVLVACGSTSGGSGSAGNKPPAPPPPPPASQNFTVTVTLDGAGSVSSAPAGIDCGRACTAQFPQGAGVALTAAAAPGYQFTGWDGACKGTGPCAITLSADAAVTAHFTAATPPPPGQHALTVAVQGQGSVTSSPQGIDCGQTCSASFADGAQVTLTAAAASGWQFGGWSGACSGSTCTVTLSSDQTATATFTQVPPPPPPPADECAGLMPASVPAPVVASLPQNECIEGTSDDGTGSYALGYTAGGDPNPTYPKYLFFTIQDGKAVPSGLTIPGGEESTTLVWSQPSGFTSFHQFGLEGGSSLESWNHNGQFITQQLVATPSYDHIPSSAAGVDPSGGTATLRHVWDDTQWSTLYKRFDKTGAAETGDVVIDHLFPGSAAAIGVALSGNALLVENATNHEFFAQWVARDGTPIGTRFNLFGQGAPVVRFLMDGSVVVGFRSTPAMAQYQNITWTYQVQDGASSAGPAPDWIAERAGDVFWPIRGGKGYAMVGSSMCGAGAVEILAASTARPCGCLEAAQATSAASVGRDGSLIVPRAPEQFGTCRYDLYPQLLK